MDGNDDNSARYIRARVRGEGFADIPFEDEWVGPKNRGAERARVRVLKAGKSTGLPVRIKTFRLKSEPGGGVIVVALAAEAEKIFADYAEGFFGGER